MTLFGVLNGDQIIMTFRNVFDASSPFAALLSQLFVYSFIVFFIYSVLSTFITILTESYEIVQLVHPPPYMR
jgi:type III secretory pathway component EscT